MYCKHCGAEIANDTRFCPNCGASTEDDQAKIPVGPGSGVPQNQTDYSQISFDQKSSGKKSKTKKPIYKRWWFWVIIALIIIGSISSRSSDGGSSSSAGTKSSSTASQQSDTAESSSSAGTSDAAAQKTTSTPKPTATPKPTPQPTEFHVGDVLDTSSLLITYLSSGTYYEDNEFLQPGEGNKYIFIELFCENNTKSDSSISYFSFECYADGYACQQYYGSDDSLSATLSAGRTTSGKIVFEVPADAEEIEIEYEYNPFSSKKATFIFEGDLDSGITPEITAEATADAYTVGDVVDTGDLLISYLECGEYHSDNQFITPGDGNRFIFCRFEVENTSEADQYISTFSFDCFADGKSCSANYVMDESLYATISAGRKTTGIISFEVPEDANIIEIEYLDNVWTSKRIVFSYSD